MSTKSFEANGLEWSPAYPEIANRLNNDEIITFRYIKTTRSYSWNWDSLLSKPSIDEEESDDNGR